MSTILIGVLCLVGFLALMFLGIPVPFAMLIPAFIGLCVMKNMAAATQIMASDILSYFNSYTLTVSPLFGLMGFLASYSGLGSSLFRALDSFIGHRKGGLASSTVVACAGFGAICGSVPATISTMSAVAYPEMRKKGYDPALAGSTIASGATLAVLIPPSSTFIIYGMATETSIGHLFMAGIGAGIVLMILDVIAVWYIAKRHPDWAPKSARSTWKERGKALISGGLLEIAIVFCLSMGCMFGGIITATEAGAVGTFGMFIILLFRRKLDVKKFVNAIKDAAKLQVMVFVLLGCASVFGRMFTISKIPALLGQFVSSLNVPAWVILVVIMIIYFILGMLADLTSLMLVTLPVFYPIVVEQLGYSSLWLGVCLCIIIGIGGITPPVGNGVFITAGCVKWDKEATISRIYAGVWPFVIVGLASLVVLTIWPEIVTWLPDMIY